MQITKYGHACLHVVDGDASIVIDPGGYSTGYEGLTGLTAVLITHVHADHLDLAGLARLKEANPSARVFCDADSARVIREAVADPASLTAGGVRMPKVAANIVAPGDSLDLGTPVRVFGGQHAVIHSDIPRAINVGYLIGESGALLCHPGDSLVVPDVAISVLAAPVAGPWMALKEAVDYVRAVHPACIVPIHEKGLASTDLAYRQVSALAPESAEFCNIDDGRTLRR